MERIVNLKGHLTQNQTTSEDAEPNEQREKYRHDWFRVNGWGYNDTEFILDKDGLVKLTGNRYLFSGQVLPKFREWVEKEVHIDLSLVTPAQVEIPIKEAKINADFLNELKGKVDEINMDKICRLNHSHGHTMQEVFALRHGELDRVVDCVIYINSHEQAETLVKSATKFNVVLIPFGGGTNVTQALLCNKEEQRMIVSVDMQRMNHVKWVDKKNMTACIEAGIMGRDLEKELARYQVVLGHEPDSVEFSTLGGWISTRASGMKKNVYGNIEDILLNTKLVTPMGTVTKSTDNPRVSSGPDLNQMVLGSEGNYGIITEAIVRVREIPKVRNYGSIVFRNWDLGVKFMYDVARSRQWPASLRLLDNTQFQFGMALKPAVGSKLKEYIDKVKKAYLLDVKKVDPNQMVVATILFEGSEDVVSMQEKTVYGIAKQYGGFKAGAENGLRGYFLTFMIAYIRDFAMNFSFIAESFETSVSWSNVQTLCKNVRDRLENDCKERGVKYRPLMSFRLTQVYETGCTIYVYFGFRYDGLKDPVQAYSEIEDGARDEVMKCGGSISHHHGVGKLRKRFMDRSIGASGIDLLKRMKTSFDPQNIFAADNTV